MRHHFYPLAAFHPQWFARENNGKWLVNFSNRLQVIKVRVLRGRMVNETFVPSDLANPFVRPFEIRLAYPDSGGIARTLQECPGNSNDEELRIEFILEVKS